MDRALPAEARRAPQQALAPVGKGGLPALVKAGVVAQHHDVGVRVERFLEFAEGLPVGGLQHVVRVEPHAVLHRGLRKGEVAGGGEVVAPRECADCRAAVPRDLHGAVGAARVGDDDLIHQAAHGVKAAAQRPFLVFHDHAETDGDHALRADDARRAQRGEQVVERVDDFGELGGGLQVVHSRAWRDAGACRQPCCACVGPVAPCARVARRAVGPVAPVGPVSPVWAGRAGSARVAGRTCRTCWASGTRRARCAGRTRRPGGTGRTRCTCRAVCLCTTRDTALR